VSCPLAHTDVRKRTPGAQPMRALDSVIATIHWFGEHRTLAAGMQSRKTGAIALEDKYRSRFVTEREGCGPGV
jgi:hypothetical protein